MGFQYDDNQAKSLKQVQCHIVHRNYHDTLFELRFNVKHNPTQ